MNFFERFNFICVSASLWILAALESKELVRSKPPCVLRRERKRVSEREWEWTPWRLQTRLDSLRSTLGFEEATQCAPRQPWDPPVPRADLRGLMLELLVDVVVAATVAVGGQPASLQLRRALVPVAEAAGHALVLRRARHRNALVDAPRGRLGGRRRHVPAHTQIYTAISGGLIQ